MSATRMPNRSVFHVWMAPPDADPAAELADDQLTHHRVVVHSADQLRAELEAGQRKLPKAGRDTPMHLTVLWLWAAMVRTGRYEGTSRDFTAACVAYDPETDDDGDRLEEPGPDPTDPSTS